MEIYKEPALFLEYEGKGYMYITMWFVWVDELGWALPEAMESDTIEIIDYLVFKGETH